MARTVNANLNGFSDIAFVREKTYWASSSGPLHSLTVQPACSWRLMMASWQSSHVTSEGTVEVSVVVQPRTCLRNLRLFFVLLPLQCWDKLLVQRNLCTSVCELTWRKHPSPPLPVILSHHSALSLHPQCTPSTSEVHVRRLLVVPNVQGT